MIPVPINNCNIHPADMIGDKPNSMRVPLLDAKITLIHMKGSLSFARRTPYIGIWQHTRYMNRVMEVYNSFYCVFIDRIGFTTDGNNLEMGSTRWRSRNPIINYDIHVYKGHTHYLIIIFLNICYYQLSILLTLKSTCSL